MKIQTYSIPNRGGSISSKNLAQPLLAGNSSSNKIHISINNNPSSSSIKPIINSTQRSTKLHGRNMAHNTGSLNLMGPNGSNIPLSIGRLAQGVRVERPASTAQLLVRGQAGGDHRSSSRSSRRAQLSALNAQVRGMLQARESKNSRAAAAQNSRSFECLRASTGFKADQHAATIVQNPYQSFDKHPYAAPSKLLQLANSQSDFKKRAMTPFHDSTASRSGSAEKQNGRQKSSDMMLIREGSPADQRCN